MEKNKTVNIYIYCEEKLKHGVFKSILPWTFRVKADTDDEAIQKAKKSISRSDVEKMLDDCRTKGMKHDFTFEIVTGEMTLPVNGTYFAHEYDKYTNGTAQKVTYSNGFSEYLVKCLNKNLIVLDGYWSDLSGNECGDTFEATERLKW